MLQATKHTAVTAVLSLLLSVHLQAADLQTAGGSNYAWYAIDQSILNNNEDRNCREPFGIIANYHQQQVSNTVSQQLDSMFINGQRKLRIPIFHANDLTTGTILSSAGGDLTQQARGNLTRFLAHIKAAGFEEILVGFFPQSRSSPHNWYTEFGTGNTTTRTRFYDTSTLQENWNLIKNLRPIIVSANIDYKIDLWNEGAAASTQPISRQYTSDLWALYNAAYGKSDTVGFSVATGSRVEAANPDPNVIGDLAADRYTVMKQVYDESGYGAPNVWDFHFYDDLDRKFRKVDAAMVEHGDNTDIIIGEAYYQDPVTLSHLQNISTNRQIRTVYAWPVTTARGCDGHSDIPFPEEYLYLPGSGATPQPVSTPEPAVIPVQQPSVNAPQSLVSTSPLEQQTTLMQAICVSSSSDIDGDGWGWENQQSCRVAETTDRSVLNNSVPVCQSANSDADGDGYGWENQASCQVAAGTSNATPATEVPSLPLCQFASSDADGDGYGWENQTSCVVPNDS